MVKQVNGLSEPVHARLAGSRQSQRLAGPCGRRRDTLRTPARSPPVPPGHSSTSTIPTAPSRPWAPDRTVTRHPGQDLVWGRGITKIEIDASGDVTEFQPGIFTAESAHCSNSACTVEPHGPRCFET
jgi:hypothetical protein